MVVKSVTGEESQLKLTEETLFQSMSTIPCQVGLVVGKLHPASDRGFVYSLLPTPPPADSAQSSACSLLLPDDAATTSKKTKNASPPTLLIDSEWVAEHARQVSRMLVGGMDVVGIYIWASESSFKASMPVMHQAIKEVARAAPLHDQVDERILIHISYSPRRWTCRNFLLTTASSDFRPCDFKMGKLLASLQYFKCTYTFQLRLPIYHKEMDGNILKDVLQSGITYLGKELGNAKLLLDGTLVNEDQQYTSGGPHKVELLLPFICNATLEACRSDEVAGIIAFGGSLCACTYLAPKVPLSQAISDIKGDIISSLRSRLDILEESEGDSAPSTDLDEANTAKRKCESGVMLHYLSKNPVSLQLPKRILIEWLPAVFICDYLKQSDTFEDVKDHCKEMLSMESWTDANTIIEPEKDALVSVDALSFWNAAAPAQNLERSRSGDYGEKGSIRTAGKGSCSNLNNYYLIALVIALVSAVVGWWIINFSYT